MTQVLYIGRGDFMISLSIENEIALRNYSLKVFMLGKDSSEILYDFLSHIDTA